MWQVTCMCHTNASYLRKVMYFRKWESVIAFLNRQLGSYPYSNGVVYTEIEASNPIQHLGGEMWSVATDGKPPHSFKVESIPFAD